MTQMTSLRVVASMLLLHTCIGFASTKFSSNRGSLLQSNKSVNHGTGDYHYNQQPRGTSFISQVSKRDLDERRQIRPPFQPQPQQWQAPPTQQQQVAAPTQPAAPAQTPQHPTPNSMKELDSISGNIKAMTNLLGDVKESLMAQTSDIRWLNKKYAEIEKRLERTEIFNAAISQDVSDMKSSDKSSTANQSRFGPIFGAHEPKQSTTESEYYVRGEISSKDSLHEKLDDIKEQMNRLNIAIKVGEVTLSSHMDDVNRRFENMKNTDNDATPRNVQQTQPNPNQSFSEPSPNMNPEFSAPQQNNMNPLFNQPQQLNNMSPPFSQQQPNPNNANPPFNQPQPPPFEPIQPIPNESTQTYPGNFEDPTFQMGSFRYERPRLGRSYEIPSPRQTIQSQSSANYNNQRRNKSFISAISERELALRRELFEPVAPIFEGPGEYFGDENYEFYPDEPFLGEGSYYQEGFYGY